MGQNANFIFLKCTKKDFEKIKSNFKITKWEGNRWSYIAPNPKYGVSIYFRETDEEVRLSVPEHLDEELIAVLIELIHGIYSLIHTSGFGYNEYDGDGDEFEMFPKKSMQEISEVWSATLFAPKEVKKIGKDKILSAPCEIIEEWEDGAIFLSIYKDRFSSFYKERKKLREHLGVK